MRQKKSVIFKKEQQEIFVELLQKLGITKENNRILKEEIEREYIKEYIREKEEDIKKFYSACKWKSVGKENNLEINIIKNIMRENNVDILKLERKKKSEEDNKYHSYRVYVFMFPEEI
jgi:hypothetical protein